MHDSFFAERALIPAGQFHEIRFEDLERDPLAQLRDIYEALGLPDFSWIRPAMKTCVESLRGYKKNKLPGLLADQRETINTWWQRCFEEWGYEVQAG